MDASRTSNSSSYPDIPSELCVIYNFKMTTLGLSRPPKLEQMLTSPDNAETLIKKLNLQASANPCSRLIEDHIQLFKDYQYLDNIQKQFKEDHLQIQSRVSHYLHYLIVGGGTLGIAFWVFTLLMYVKNHSLRLNVSSVHRDIPLSACTRISIDDLSVSLAFTSILTFACAWNLFRNSKAIAQRKEHNNNMDHERLQSIAETLKAYADRSYDSLSVFSKALEHESSQPEALVKKSLNEHRWMELNNHLLKLIFRSVTDIEQFCQDPLFKYALEPQDIQTLKVKIQPIVNALHQDHIMLLQLNAQDSSQLCLNPKKKFDDQKKQLDDLEQTELRILYDNDKTEYEKFKKTAPLVPLPFLSQKHIEDYKKLKKVHGSSVQAGQAQVRLEAAQKEFTQQIRTLRSI